VRLVFFGVGTKPVRARGAEALLIGRHADADALAAADSGEKALAVLQKIANIRRRHVEEVCLAPLAKGRPKDRKMEERPARPVAPPEGVFRDWLVHMLREQAQSPEGYRHAPPPSNRMNTGCPTDSGEERLLIMASVVAPAREGSVGYRSDLLCRSAIMSSGLPLAAGL